MTKVFQEWFAFAFFIPGLRESDWPRVAQLIPWLMLELWFLAWCLTTAPPASPYCVSREHLAIFNEQMLQQFPSIGSLSMDAFGDPSLFLVAVEDVLSWLTSSLSFLCHQCSALFPSLAGVVCNCVLILYGLFRNFCTHFPITTFFLLIIALSSLKLEVQSVGGLPTLS